MWEKAEWLAFVFCLSFNTDISITKLNEKIKRIECKTCKSMVIYHATSLKRHVKKYIYTKYYISCKSNKTVEAKLDLTKYNQRKLNGILANFIIEIHVRWN